MMLNRDEKLDKRISWAVFVILSAIAGLVGGVLAVSELYLKLGKNWFWVLLGFVFVLRLIINRLRPKYENAGNFLEKIYCFLVKQFPMVD